MWLKVGVFFVKKPTKDVAMKNLILCLAVAFILSGCASPPPLNFSVPNVGPSQTKINAEVKSITVSVARPDEKTGDLPMGITNIVPLWKMAIEDSLNRMAIFKDDSSRKISLSVKILKFDTPSFGIEMTTYSAARYEITDRENGTIIYTADIDSAGICPGDYAFLGVTRSIESMNRSVQNNISKFLMQLETVNIEKPMFPAENNTTHMGKRK